MDLASGIAGLIGLAGLAVNSASSLYTFCRKIPRVGGEVEAVVDEIRRLKETLESIQQVAVDRGMLKPSSRTPGVIGKLQDEIKGCKNDLEAWNTSMCALKLDDGKFLEMRSKVSSRRDQLSSLVGLLVVDLEMSTSLTAQTIESKVDTFVLEQASSQQITVSHLEQIQEGIQSSATLQSATQETILDIARSTSRIHEMLHEIHLDQTSSQHTTHLQAERLDAALVAIQRSLLKVSKRGNPRPRMTRTTRRMCDENSPALRTGKSGEVSRAETFLENVQRITDHSAMIGTVNKLVDLAVNVRYRGGKAHFEALAVPDPDFEAAGSETKLRMVKYLQDLRLLLWLLCRKENNLGEMETSVFSGLPQSHLAPEAHLVSSWTHSTLPGIPCRGLNYSADFSPSLLNLLESWQALARLSRVESYRLKLRLDGWARSRLVAGQHADIEESLIFFELMCELYFRKWAREDEDQFGRSSMLRTKGLLAETEYRRDGHDHVDR